MVYIYVAHWMLSSWYGIKFFIDNDSNHGDIMMMIMMKVKVMVKDDSNLP